MRQGGEETGGKSRATADPAKKGGQMDAGRKDRKGQRPNRHAEPKRRAQGWSGDGHGSERESGSAQTAQHGREPKKDAAVWA